VARRGEPPATADAPYLLVFERDSSWVFPLPRSGEIVIGRAESADLRLQDPAASPELAKISVGHAETRISEARPDAFVHVNGERIAAPRNLVSGDTITLRGATLVYHSSARRRSMCAIVDFAQFRQRADEEFERTERFGRPWSIVAIHVGGEVHDRLSIVGVVASQLRRIDLACWDGDDQVLLLLAETGSDAAMPMTARLLASLRSKVPIARAGFATCPMDGCDVDALLSSARAAALAAEIGKVVSAAETARTMQIGSRRVIVADPAMVRVFALIQRLAAADMPVLIHGETGTGKDLVASAVHLWSSRRDKPLVTFNCAAIPGQLVESELFGYEKGAFSGAVTSKLGLFSTAAGGTVFLDEIGELPAEAQAKLLRVLETKRLRPVGEVREHEIDIRVVAATNRNLEEDVRAGRFRKDLFFRLKGAMLWLPPLRDRRRELPILAQAFLAEACAATGRPAMTISDAAMHKLTAYSWPGNVRELQNLMNFAAAVASELCLEPRHLADWIGEDEDLARPDLVAVPPEATPPPAVVPQAPAPAVAATPSLSAFRPLDEEIRELERSRMIAALAATGGNQTRAAELIGMPLRTFVAKLKTYNLAGGGKTRGEG
jgi:DNA-binding NtrC family response regulator